MQPAPGRPERSDRPDRPERYDRPRFRQDLVAEPIDDQGGRFIDVMDPDSGNLFRFYEVEYSLACAMDGERDVPGIVKWAQDELGLTPSPQEVRTVIQTLGDLGFIDAGGAAAQPSSPDLVPGVVVGAPAKSPPTAIELGNAGGGAPPRAEALPPAPNLALGAPGATGRRQAEPGPPPTGDDLGLGPSGRRIARKTPSPQPLSAPPPLPLPSSPPPSPGDVSVDLSHHIAVRPDDVKEAVRASKVMAAVDTARELSLEEQPTIKTPPPLPQPPEMTFERPEITRLPEAQLEGRPEPKVGKSPLTRPSSSTRPPVELPRPPAPVTSPPPAAEAPRGASPVLVAVVVLVLLAVAGFVVWKYVLDTRPPEVGTSVAPPPAVLTPPPPPPPPPAPTAKITLETPPPDEIQTGRQGVIETIVADKTVVKEGTDIVRLDGAKQLEAEIANLERDSKRLQDLIAAATKRHATAQAANNKGAMAALDSEIADRQKSLATKQGQLAIKRADLSKVVLRAQVAGTFSPAVKPRSKVTATDVVARIQRDPTPVATFKVGDVRQFAVKSNAEVAIGRGELLVTCTVVDIQADSMKVVCPVDPALGEGADVTLKPPPPSVPAESPGAGTAAGAAGSAGAAASEPPEGGAAAPAPGAAEPSTAAPAGPAEVGSAGSAAAPDPAATK